MQQGRVKQMRDEVAYVGIREAGLVTDKFTMHAGGRHPQEVCEDNWDCRGPPPQEQVA